jgi:hypothetical protein
MEASQENSTGRDGDTPGPLDNLLGPEDTQVKASTEGSPEHQAQEPKVEEDKDVDMEGVIEESQQDGSHDSDDDDDGPVTRGGRNLRVSGPKSSFTYQTDRHRLVESLPNAKAALMKAATLNQVRKMTRKRKRCLHRTMSSARSLPPPIVALVLVGDPLGYAPEREDRYGADGTPPMKKTRC